MNRGYELIILRVMFQFCILLYIVAKLRIFSDTIAVPENDRLNVCCLLFKLLISL